MTIKSKKTEKKTNDKGTTPPSVVTLQKIKFQPFKLWLVGDMPLITHAWSEKAKREMLSKQVKSVKQGREAKDPQANFLSSLYEMGDGGYGFPVTGIKKCLLSAAHKDKGIPQSTVMRALWLNGEMTRTRPALAGAICDLPLIRIWGTEPEMREDMVKIGKGLNKTADLSYRGQFTTWAFRVTGRYNPFELTPEILAFLAHNSGLSCGIGEWRNEKGGVFGAFHVADVNEEKAWDSFAAGKGKLPSSPSFAVAAE
jgi:hypothetical protein